MKKIIEKAYKVIIYTLIIFMLLFININNFIQENIWMTVKLLTLVLIFIGILVIINNKIINKLSEKALKIIIYTLLIILLILECLSTYYFRVKFNWDVKDIMDTAISMAQNGEVINGWYFKTFPNNIAALAMFFIAMKICLNKVAGAYILNIVLVFITGIFTIKSANELGGRKLGVNAALLLVMFAPFYLYCPILYTDTLSVLFPILTFYLWLKAKRLEDVKKKKLYYAGMTIASFIGFCIKPVTAIVLIAVIIDEILMCKKQFKMITISIILFIILNSIYGFLINKIVIRDVKHNDTVYPYTHWVMMGLNKPKSEGGTSIGWGAYSPEDVETTENQTTYNEKVTKNIEVIRQRLEDFGIEGYTSFLINKLKYIWNDSTFYVFNKIGWDTINRTSLPYKYVLGEKSEDILKPFIKIYYSTIMIMVLVTVVTSIKSEKKEEIRILILSILGMTIFLLLWEARSRYIYSLIPILVILASMSLKEKK